MLLAGDWVDRDRKFDVDNPQDGSVLDSVPRADCADAVAAVDAAVVGAAYARRAPAHRRMAVLHAATDLMCDGVRAEELATTIASEGVKTIGEARKEVGRCVQTLRLAAEEARRNGGEVVRFDQAPGSEGGTATTSASR